MALLLGSVQAQEDWVNGMKVEESPPSDVKVQLDADPYYYQLGYAGDGPANSYGKREFLRRMAEEIFEQVGQMPSKAKSYYKKGFWFFVKPSFQLIVDPGSVQFQRIAINNLHKEDAEDLKEMVETLSIRKALYIVNHKPFFSMKRQYLESLKFGLENTDMTYTAAVIETIQQCIDQASSDNPWDRDPENFGPLFHEIVKQAKELEKKWPAIPTKFPSPAGQKTTRPKPPVTEASYETGGN